MKKNLSRIVIIAVAIAITWLAFWSYQRYQLMSYRKSEVRSLDFNPYTYVKKTKASVSFFYKSLPSDVRVFMTKKKISFDDLTSCEADLIPGGFSEFALSFFDGKKSNLLVISTENQYQPKREYNLSHLLETQRKSDQDSFEIHCLPSLTVLNSKLFQPTETESHFVDQLRNHNQDLIAIKLGADSSLQIIAFNPDDKKFHAVGKLGSLEESGEEKMLPQNTPSPAFFTSLPQKIQAEIEQKNPKHENLTSCQGDLFPSRNANYAVSYTADKQVQAFVFEVNSKGDLLATQNISSLVASFKKGADDDLEIQCRHGSYVLLNPEFKLKISEKDLAIYYRNSNHEILRVKSRKSPVSSYLAYSSKDGSFHFIGTSKVP